MLKFIFKITAISATVSAVRPQLRDSDPKSLSDVYRMTHDQSTLAEDFQDATDEIIKTSIKIYQSLLSLVKSNNSKPITIVAPGQSPSYVALAMLNLSIYDPDKVNLATLKTKIEFEFCKASILNLESSNLIVEFWI